MTWPVDLAASADSRRPDQPGLPELKRDPDHSTTIVEPSYRDDRGAVLRWHGLGEDSHQCEDGKIVAHDGYDSRHTAERLPTPPELLPNTRGCGQLEIVREATYRRSQLSQELASLIAANTHTDGVFRTEVPNLYLYRHSCKTVSVQGLLAPALAIVAQGEKQVMLGDEAYTYDANNYLVVSVDLPLTGNVSKASRATPYLGIRYDLDVSQIASLRMDGKLPKTPRAKSDRGIFVSSMTPDLADAVVRLMRLLKKPQDIPVVAPLLHQEILYRLLCGEQGGVLERIALTDSQTHRVMKAVKWLKKNYREPFTIDSIAHEANMSPSGLHEHFKRLTNMSPLQFQKQLRLQEARRLLLADAMDAASAAYSVGYISPSQFSREYARLFGLPPLRDVEHFRQQPHVASL